jgi:hypothetical protein
MAYVITRSKGTMRNAQPTSDGTSSTHFWQSAGFAAVCYGIGGMMILAGLVMLVVDGHLGAYGFAVAVGAGLWVMLIEAPVADRTSPPRERKPPRGTDVREGADRSHVRRSGRPGELVRRASRVARWRRRHLNARAIIAVIVLLGLLAAEVAAVLGAAA